MTTTNQKTINFLRKSVVLVAVYLCFQNTAQSQVTNTVEMSKHSIYADGGFGLAWQASINYERRILTAEKFSLYARVGAGGAEYLLGEGGPGGLAAITGLKGFKNGHFEINAGVFVGQDRNTDKTFVFPLVDGGYRYQKPEGGFIFRAKFGILGLGIGIGYAF